MRTYDRGAPYSRRWRARCARLEKPLQCSSWFWATITSRRRGGGVRVTATGCCEEAHLQAAEANALLAADNGEYELRRWVINTPRFVSGEYELRWWVINTPRFVTVRLRPIYSPRYAMQRHHVAAHVRPRKGGAVYFLVPEVGVAYRHQKVSARCGSCLATS
jgi:hypothetical protein